MREIVAIITPWSCDDENVAVDGDRIVFSLRNTDVGILSPGDLARIDGFESKGFRNGIAEYIRKDYRGENIARCAFRRVKVKKS